MFEVVAVAGGILTARMPRKVRDFGSRAFGLLYMRPIGTKPKKLEE